MIESKKKKQEKIPFFVYVNRAFAVLLTVFAVFVALVNLSGFYFGTPEQPLYLFGYAIDHKAQQILCSIALIVGAIAAICWLGVFGRWKKALKDLIKAQEQREVKNQEAIIQFMDDIAELSEGDLTVQAKVNENFTGGIADSVNYAIDSMRGLVATINQTSQRVTEASTGTKKIADEMLISSAIQGKKIHSITEITKNMVESLNRVASSSSDTAEIAYNAVDIAKDGANRVYDTIQGMNNIRNNIQETSKRIKRLAESSQEIGNSIGIIKGIADQTNILALNAAIQATSAGEAGKGFAVVADEIQRLAERSANATKHIDNLVKITLGDMEQAMRSMENSTGEVVKGADIAEQAGQSLNRIQDASTNMAALIEKVSDSTLKVSSMAENVLQDMSGVNQSANVTNDNIAKVTTSIKILTRLSAELNDSVAGFKLPSDS